jgi:hypothetical protein
MLTKDIIDTGAKLFKQLLVQRMPLQFVELATWDWAFLATNSTLAAEIVLQKARSRALLN